MEILLGQYKLTNNNNEEVNMRKDKFYSFISKTEFDLDRYYYGIRVDGTNGGTDIENVASIVWKNVIKYNGKSYNMKVDINNIRVKSGQSEVIRIPIKNVKKIRDSISDRITGRTTTYKYPSLDLLNVYLYNGSTTAEVDIDVRIIDDEGNPVPVSGIWAMRDIDGSGGWVVKNFKAKQESENTFIKKNAKTDKIGCQVSSNNTMIFATQSDNIAEGTNGANVYLKMEDVSLIGLTKIWNGKGEASDLHFLDGYVPRDRTYTIEAEAVNGTITKADGKDVNAAKTTVENIEENSDVTIRYSGNTGCVLKRIILEEGKANEEILTGNEMNNFLTSYKFSAIKSDHTIKVVYELPEIIDNGNLEINLIDYHDSTAIDGAKFRIKVKEKDSTEERWLENESGLEEFETIGGKINIGNLPEGTYTVYQTDVAFGYQLSRQKDYKSGSSEEPSRYAWKTELTIGQGGGRRLTVKNIRYGNLVINKSDEDNSNVKLRCGVKIKVGNGNGSGNEWLSGDEGYTWEDNHQYNVSYDNAQIYYTNEGTLNLGKLKYETYTVYEVETPSSEYKKEMQTGYESGYNRIWLGDRTISSESAYLLSVTNFKAISISGYVWEDNRANSATSDTNGIWDNGENKLKGVIVNLKEKSGGVIVKTTTTDDKGEYKLDEINPKRLAGYYVEFNYGNTYKNYIPVKPSFDGSIKNGSRALKNSIAQKDEDIIKDGIATSDKRDNSVYGLTASYITGLKNGINIENFNLGIKKLLNPEFEIKENISYIKLRINGYDYTYKYGTDIPTIARPDAPTTTVPGYTRDIYPSDIVYNNPDANKKFYVNVIYEIKITNNSTYNIRELYMEDSLNITKLTNTFDTGRYTLDNTYESSKNSAINNEIKKWTASGNTAEYNSTSGGTKFTPFKSNNSVTTYIQYRVNQSALNTILNNPSGVIEANPTKAIATGYHTYDRYDYSWENDISKEQKNHQTIGATKQADAPYLLLKLPDDKKGRKISGIVFEDRIVDIEGEDYDYGADSTNFETEKSEETVSTDGTENIEGQDEENAGSLNGENSNNNDEKYINNEVFFSGTDIEDSKEIEESSEEEDVDKEADEMELFTKLSERNTYGEILGNGLYDEYENYVRGVKVQLVNPDLTVAQIYKSAENDGKVTATQTDAVVNSDEKGKYELEGVIPGLYYIQFIYEDGTIKLFDTSGKEVYMDPQTKYKSTIITSGKIKDLIRKKVENKEYDTVWYRENKNYSTAVDNMDARVKYNKKERNDVYAETPEIDIFIENTKENEKQIIVVNGIQSEEKSSEIENIYFGIIRQPRNLIYAKKYISNIKLINGQGNVVFNGNPATQKLAGVIGNLEVERDSNGLAIGSKFVRAELDSSSIYGSTVQVVYTIEISNNSDVNYYGVDYYWFGEITENSREVKLNVKKILEEQDQGLKLITYKSNDGLKVEETSSTVKIDSGETPYDKTLKVYHIKGIGELCSVYKKLDESLGERSKCTILMVSEKILSSNDTDIDLMNIADVLREDVDLSEDPEKYTVNQFITVPDQSETRIVITPPTGLNKQIIIIISISGIIILSIIAGIILIVKKRKV